MRIARLSFAIAAATLTLTNQAAAWWNDEWTMRKQITVDTSASGANITDAIGTSPVLIRLHAGNFRFAASKADGSDLRFVAGDDKTPLKYHIERYDSLLGEGLVWLNLPNVQPGSKINVWLYYGNQKALAAPDAKGTYDADTVLVYHFAERGIPATDSSAWANNSQDAGQAANGSLIGSGLRLDGKATLTLPATPSLALAEGASFSWSAWIKPAALQRNAAIYSRKDTRNGVVIGLDDGAPFVEITKDGVGQRSSAGVPVAPGGWHHIGVSATPGLITLYLDGAPYATLNASLPALNVVAKLGGDTAIAVPAVTPEVASEPAAAAPAADGTAAEGTATAEATAETTAPAAPVVPAPVAPAPVAAAGFIGDIDELQISKNARGAGFIKFAATQQGPAPSKLLSFSVDEETSSWLSGYFGILLKAVTLDGWVIIGFLGLMALLGWIVMIEKHGYLKRQSRANDIFSPAFRNLGEDITAMVEREGLAVLTGENARENVKKHAKARAYVQKNSSLCRLYETGVAEIRKFVPEGDNGTTLNAEAIASIRATLDGCVIREMQALNRQIVVLTLSIAGGPFLGLLGTVIGVMITFASIAMTGDVNINAIAPGIAGALMATVAGLAVAIPALFGYNWLTLRIKNLTSDMQAFVDEFVAKIAVTYGKGRPSPVVARMAAE
ncbi:DUF2341 domain-containing protein [Rhodomicrobium lacus]|uniref:DUF2341 domain-containing protein n=1 Tax=Rhodomicrobium lacus TaxID=2498452 RepID=UPI001FDFF24B|nr:MotA/TolQ/ExbB proton channel family protein [Rhodomicrobium lacus]